MKFSKTSFNFSTKIQSFKKVEFWQNCFLDPKLDFQNSLEKKKSRKIGTFSIIGKVSLEGVNLTARITKVTDYYREELLQ